jgi:hypothetical protein
MKPSNSGERDELACKNSAGVLWDKALTMQCGAPKGRECSQTKSRGWTRGRFRCEGDAMRWFISELAWAGTCHRNKYLARQLEPGLVRAALNGACTIGQERAGCEGGLEGRHPPNDRVGRHRQMRASVDSCCYLADCVPVQNRQQLKDGR